MLRPAAQGPPHKCSLRLAADRDRAAVAGAVSARHRCFPRKLCIGRESRDRVQHRLGPAREHVEVVPRLLERLGHERRVDHHLAFGTSPLPPHGRAFEAEKRRWAAEPLRQVRNGAMPMPPPTSSGRSTLRQNPLLSGPRTGQPLAAGGVDERACPWPDGVDQEAELAGPREAETHRARQHPPGRAEHEELARVARDEGPSLDAGGGCTGRCARSR